MAWSVEFSEDDGKWHWSVVLTAYGAAGGEADSKEEAERRLSKAQAALMADDWP